MTRTAASVPPLSWHLHVATCAAGTRRSPRSVWTATSRQMPPQLRFLVRGKRHAWFRRLHPMLQPKFMFEAPALLMCVTRRLQGVGTRESIETASIEILESRKEKSTCASFNSIQRPGVSVQDVVTCDGFRVTHALDLPHNICQKRGYPLLLATAMYDCKPVIQMWFVALVVTR